MSEYILPATTYVSPSRLARKNTLNTIVEDRIGEKEEEGISPCKRKSGRGRWLCTGLPDRAKSTSPVPSLTSSISSYYHTRESSDFDDLYDVSDDDSDISPSIMSNTISVHSAASNEVVTDKPLKERCPSLIIPSPSLWPTIEKVQIVSPPRPPKIPLSPAALSMLCQDLPGPSNPPSLVSSLGSDPLINGSAPVTPDERVHGTGSDLWGQREKLQNAQDSSHKKERRPIISIRTDEATISLTGTVYSPEDRISVRDFASSPHVERNDSPVLGSESEQSDFGVALPPDALETLQFLCLEPPQIPGSTIDDARPHIEMEQTRFPLRPCSPSETPTSQISEYSISGLSIPSPGGFFASLDLNARHTWHVPVSVPESALPPSSTTAENFYSCPWNSRPSALVEQVIEIDNDDTERPPKAKQQPLSAVKDVLARVESTSSPRFAADEIFDIHDNEYEKTIQESAEKALDRTSTWLAAQHSYLAALREANPVNDLGFEAEQDLKRMSTHKKNDSLGSKMRKAVKFLEEETSRPKSRGGSLDSHPDTAIFYEAFKHIRAESGRSDAFRHRHTRSDSLQSIRICLPHQHISNIQGNFYLTETDRPHTHRPISMFPGKDPETPETTSEQNVIARVQRERQALEQVNTRMWVVEAIRYLNGGKLINSPAKSYLCKPLALGDISHDRVFSPARVLDLAGQKNGDWAWHVAREFPHSRIYTANPASSQFAVRGPRNHRHHTVSNLWTLPYPDNYFRIISARSLFAHLKTERHSIAIGHGSDDFNVDEYDLCLKECLRCLKPGGYLEFFTIDSEILNAGSRGTALSVEFAFNLKTRGYDPSPTKAFLGRLRRAGFDDIKRAWTILHMGAPTRGEKILPETPPPNASCFDLDYGGKGVEAVQGPVGSTWDAGELTGIVGAWAWEGWMLRLQEEMGRKKEGLLEGVGAVLEEGRRAGSGWRCLSGWARKPGG